MIYRLFRSLIPAAIIFVLTFIFAGWESAKAWQIMYWFIAFFYVVGLLDMDGPDINESIHRQNWLYYHGTAQGKLFYPNGFGNGTDASTPLDGLIREEDDHGKQEN